MKMAGLSSLGDGVGDKFGILPFRGNILNPSEATIGTIYQNAEIQDLIRALGLDQTNYKGFKSLRYHKILIMSDQVIYLLYLFKQNLKFIC
jgi:DNA gyrase/topoisomerase IV subunit B